MILDDENILIKDTRSGVGSNLNLIWDCRGHSREDLLEIIKFAFSRNDLSKDLYWEPSKVFEKCYFLQKDLNNNRTIIILTLKINKDGITLFLHGRYMYHIFDIDIAHMLDIPMEFANWIKKLGFNPHPLVSSSDDIKEYIFKP
jgi:hypothetical protein